MSNRAEVRARISRNNVVSLPAEPASERKHGRPLLEDPLFSARLAQVEIELMALEITNLRFLDQMRRTNQPPGADVSMLKIKGTELQQAATEILMEVAGVNAMAFQSDHLWGTATEESIGPEWAATVAPDYFYTRASSIYGGSNEIQRNIVAQMTIGL